MTIETWLRFLVWLVIGAVIYFGYSAWHSRLATGKALSGDIQQAMDSGVLTPPESR